ncbi:hypothetical protein I9W82_001926 [Candida metapsilosis]|uniref:Uncharacterized protein n=1 Tax=Candida metapsilosis TaxID=273372 RepID=A0A8H7ZJD3_9ASCO|nr:hypothetical protein I9W82_001926 [Candida metapsilosis]
MSKASNAKKLMNLLYRETASSIETSQAIPQITRQLYNEPDLEPESVFTTTSTRRKLPATDALKVDTESIPSNILSFKCPLSFITKQDFQNLLPKEHNLTYALNPINNFEVVKKRSDDLLQFQNEYLLLFKSHLNARVYQLETRGKLINGLQFKTQYQPIDIIDELVPPKLQVPNHQSLVDQIKALESQAKAESTPFSSYDESYPILSHIINAPNRAKSILIHNWPFGLKENLVIESLWNYNLAVNYDMDPNAVKSPIEPIYSNIMQGVNIIKMNFKSEHDALRFIRNFHGTKWLKLQNFRKVEEKVSYLPLHCETL